jgi:carboxyl-terminal processing protease
VIALPTFYEDFDARRRGDKNYKSAARDVARLLGELKAKHVDAVLMDLRNNGGGSLSEAIDLTGLFVGKGPVVQVRSANGRVQEGTNTNTDMTWSGPFAVLVNRNSASASEIFAGAIQDYGRGLIIGENTYGKGTVQNLVDLDQMSQSEKPAFGELKMTIQQFFRVDGASTQLHGVQPDIAFPVTGDFAENGEATYKNALPWASIGPADFKPSADLKSILPMLKTLHATRVAKDKPWLAYEADITDARKLRAETSISLNEKARRAERDAQEAKRKQRHPELARADAPDTAASPTPAQTGSAMKKGESADQARQAVATAKSTTTPAVATDPSQDDGLQADERSIQERHAEEKARKEQPDVVLDEAAHILADEVTLLRSDTRLAARALPHAAGMDKPVD